MKNGQITKQKFIYYSDKKNLKTFLKLLWDEGFIIGYTKCSYNSKNLKVFLKYEKNHPVIKSLKFISKPARQVYYSINQIYKIKKSKWVIVFLTNLGFQTSQNCKKLKIGGQPTILIE